jgi:prevent-host-death family protein
MAQIETERKETEASTEEVRRNFGELVNRVAFGGERLIITRHGKRIAQLTPIEPEPAEESAAPPASTGGAA